jgi:hypothetical protein
MTNTKWKNKKLNQQINALWKIVFTKSSFPYEYGEFKNKMSHQRYIQFYYNCMLIAK